MTFKILIKQTAVLILLLAGLFISAGCILFTEPYKPVGVYTIGPIPAEILKDDLVFTVEPFMNETPCRFKMVYSKEDNEVVVDSYNRWAQTPEIMLTAYLQGTFREDENVNTSNQPHFAMSGTITEFKINLPQKQVELSVRYRIWDYNTGTNYIRKSLNFTQPVKEESPKNFAVAMSEVAKKYADVLKKELAELRNLVLKKDKDKKDKDKKEKKNKVTGNNA
jgi:ABC-type uncharacterized transport system auxiliary subunit